MLRVVLGCMVNLKFVEFRKMCDGKLHCYAAM